MIDPVKLFDIVSKYSCNHLTEMDAVDWAIDLVEEGENNKSILELASLTPPELSNAGIILRKLIEEEGYEYPSQEQLHFAEARLLAIEIVEHNIQPNKGAAKIGELCAALDWPKELGEIHLVAHEQTGHEKLGITAESVIPDIFVAAKNIMNMDFRDKFELKKLKKK